MSAKGTPPRALPRLQTRLRKYTRPFQAPPTCAHQHRRQISTTYGYTPTKSLLYTEPGDPPSVLRLHTHSISPAHSTLITARLLASPLNPADINTIQGSYPSQPPFTTALGTTEPAAVPGNEGVAIITAVGSEAEKEGWKKGEWVLMKKPGVGTWQTCVQAPASSFLRLPEAERQGVSAVQAGTVSVNPCTAWAMLKGWTGGGAVPPDSNRGEGVREGDWVVQNGANSGVGRAAMQLARAWGVRTMNVVRARPGGEGETETLKRELRGLGADVVFTEDEAGEKGFGERMASEFLDNGRQKIKLALNCVGGRSALNLAKVLAPGGTHVTYGAMAKQPLSLPAGMLIFKDVAFRGFWVSRWAEANPSEKMRAVREVLGLIREGKFRDTPMREMVWRWETSEDALLEAVRGTLEGFRGGKGVFVFKDE